MSISIIDPIKIINNLTETIPGSSLDAVQGKGIDTRLIIIENKANINPTLDFLFVDYWVQGDNLDAPTSKGLLAMTYPEGFQFYECITQRISVIDGDGFSWIPTNGNEIGDNTPISQTTIFVHPTTFQRYLFNGTTMVEYDDVDGVVPKWLEWIAFINPVDGVYNAKQLNVDEKNQFSVDVEFNYDDNQSYFISNKLKKELNINNFFGLSENDGVITIPSGLPSPYNSCSIKQRVRGNPPKLVSAETNIAGDKVILTFDKEMSNYVAEDYPFYFEIDYGNVNSGDIPKSTLSIEGNTITIDFTQLGIINPLLYVIIAYSSGVESFDLGLPEQFYVAVTNNVPEHPQITDAYLTGDELTLVFDKDMSEENWGNAVFCGALCIMYFDFERGNNLELSILSNPSPIVHGNLVKLYIPFALDPDTSLPTLTYFPSNNSEILHSIDGGSLEYFFNYQVTQII